MSERVTPPWVYVTAKVAAKELSVDIELVQGLAASRRPDFRAVKSTTPKGNSVWLISREDVTAMKVKMGG